MDYKIIGKCVFGNRQMDENGRMDLSQFISGEWQEVETSNDAVFGMGIARQYGAKPITKIEFYGKYNSGIIDVYSIGGEYAGTMVKDGWVLNTRHTFLNTASPMDFVKYFDRPVEQFI